MAVTGNEILVGRSGAAARVTSPFGGVHVFRRDARSGRWTERLVLAPADAAPGDEFGATLAVDGRLLAVGAPHARQGRGAVYLFERTAQGRWVQRAVLTAAAGARDEGFGTALALKGAVVVVGAPMHGGQRGRALVFQRGADGRWAERAVLTSADTSHMGFGQALALVGEEVLVGAAGPLVARRAADGQVRPAEAQPQVFVFRDSGGRWGLNSQLTRPDSATTASEASGFGVSLATNGADVWVADPLASGSGVVFQFRRQSSGRWASMGRLVPGDGAARGFGTTLASDSTDLLVSAPSGDTAAVYAFRVQGSANANARATPAAGAAAVPVWTEVDRIVLKRAADSEQARLAPEGAPLEPRPAWFSGTVALAAAHGVAAVGLAWGNKFEGWGLVLRRDSGARDSTADASPGTGPRWHVLGALADTSWNTAAPLSGAVVPCRHGQAKVFRCDHVDLLAFLPIAALGSSAAAEAASAASSTVEVSGLWGWSDSATGREFALVGRTDGTSFVEVTDPTRPKVLGVLPIPDSATPSLWRDIKVYKNYAFIVSDAAGAHGMQIFDLTQLRSVPNAPTIFHATARYTRIASAHTLILNPATGFAYSAGSNGGGETCGGGLHMLDVRTPTAPVFVGCYAEPKAGGESGGTYIHDAQCVVYNGPDTTYRGHEICLNSSAMALSVADVTDKQHPKTLSVATYPNIGYVHQGWLTEDQRYFFVNDELDELRQVFAGDSARIRTRTLVFDLRELADPVLVTEFLGTTGATDHNLYVRGRYMYQSNYTAGLRVIDVADPRQPQEVGYFDTAPAYDDTPALGAPRLSQGTWTNYPYFKSGAIAVTSMSEGLYLVRFRRAGPP